MLIEEHSLKAPEIFGRDMTLRIALPKTSKKRLPLMLVHDAQNFFDAWEGEETKTGAVPMLDSLFAQGLPPFALAGIDTWQDRSRLDRFTDYSPWRSSDIMGYLPTWKDVTVNTAGGRGDAYADFVAHSVLPFLEGRYPVGGDASLRGIGGSSMAAMASLYIGTKYLSLFSRFAFFSPALWCFQREFSAYIEQLPAFKKGDRIYMDIGRKESSDPEIKEFPEIYLQGAQFIYDNLKERAPNLMFVIDEEGEHSMPSIARHLPTAWRYLWE